MPAVESIRGGRFKYNLKSFSMFRCRRRCSWKHKTYKSCLSTRLVFFLHRSLSTLLSSTAFLCSSTPPLLFSSNTFVSVSNLKLFSISAVRNFIVRYFSDCYPFPPTHCLDNPLSHQQRHHFWIHSTCLGVCLFRFPNI